MPCFVAFRSHAESWALKKAAGPVRFAAFDLDGNGRGCLEGGQSAFPKGSGRHRGLEPRECMCMVDALARRELGCFRSAKLWPWAQLQGSIILAQPPGSQEQIHVDVLGIACLLVLDLSWFSCLSDACSRTWHVDAYSAIFALSQDQYIPVHASCPASSSAYSSILGVCFLLECQTGLHSQAWAAGATTVPACPSCAASVFGDRHS